MAGYIEDRWLKKRPDPTTGKRERTALWGTKTARYRVGGIPGVRKRSFTTSEDAKAWKAKAEAGARAGAFYDPRDGQTTLREYVEETWWPTLRVPPGTRESMRSRVFKHILPHMGNRKLNAIGADEIKWWLTQAEQHVDVGTVRVTWRHFSSIMQAATAAKKIPANPFRDPDVRKLVPAAPKSKAKAWAQESVTAQRTALTPRYRVLVDLGVGALMRQGEAFGVSPDDLDGEVIRITRQVVKVGGKLAFAPPKGNKEREGPCPPELAEAVKAHMDEFEPVEVTLPWVDPDRPNLPWDERPLRTVRLLVTTPQRGERTGSAINRGTFDEKQWKPALVRAGIIPEPERTLIERSGKEPLRRIAWAMPREDGFHVLRHTGVSIALAAGETIQKVAQWLGHSDPAFTYRVYAHFLPDAGSRGAAALGAWLRAARSPEVPAVAETPSALPQGDAEATEKGS